MGNFFKNNLSKRQFYLGSQKTSFCALLKNVFFFKMWHSQPLSNWIQVFSNNNQCENYLMLEFEPTAFQSLVPIITYYL